MKYLVKMSFNRRLDSKFINFSFKLKLSNRGGEQGKSMSRQTIGLLENGSIRGGAEQGSRL